MQQLIFMFVNDISLTCSISLAYMNQL